MSNCIRCGKGPEGSRILHNLIPKVRVSELEKKWLCNVCVADMYRYLDKDALISALQEMRVRGDEISYIRTYSGGKFWPLDPHPDDLRIEDIAHALSNLCRWTGHSRKFYSVAQHCCLVSDNLPPSLQLEGLLHDASEAYLSDLSRPIKHAAGLGEVYRKVERRIEKSLATKFGFSLSQSPEVKVVDNQLLYTEARDLMQGFVWSKDSASTNQTRAPKYLSKKIEPWSPKKAEREFLKRFYLLTGNSVKGNNTSGSSGRAGVGTEDDSVVAPGGTTGSGGSGGRTDVRGPTGGGRGIEISGEEMDQYVQSGLTAGL